MGLGKRGFERLEIARVDFEVLLVAYTTARDDRERKEEEGGSLAANQHPGLSLVVTVHPARPLLT